VAVGDRAALRDQVHLFDLLGGREALELAALEDDQIALAQGREPEQDEEAGEQQADALLDQLCGRDPPCRSRSGQGVVAPVAPVVEVAGWAGVVVVGAEVVVGDAAPVVPVGPAVPVVPASG